MLVNWCGELYVATNNEESRGVPLWQRAPGDVPPAISLRHVSLRQETKALWPAGTCRCGEETKAAWPSDICRCGEGTKSHTGLASDSIRGEPPAARSYGVLSGQHRHLDTCRMGRATKMWRDD